MRYLLLPLILAAAACTPTTSPNETMYNLNHEFGGRPANEFFHIYGTPVGEAEYKDGNRIYRWVSVDPYTARADAAYYAQRKTSGDFPAKDSYTHAVETTYCEVRVYTNEEDTIQRFAITVDTTGKWSASRCSELFATPSVMQ